MECTLTLAPYVEPVTHVEIVVAMATGALAFGEARRVRESAAGAAIVLAGVIALSQAGERTPGRADVRMRKGLPGSGGIVLDVRT